MTLFHFIGIKGSGMSSLAQILHDSSYQVQGSDVETYFFTEDALRERNISIYPFDENNIKEGMTVIAGNAFPTVILKLRKHMNWGLKLFAIMTFSENICKSSYRLQLRVLMAKHQRLDS